MLGLAACGSSDGGDTTPAAGASVKPLTIGLVNGPNNNPFWAQLGKGAQAEAAKLDNVKLVETSLPGQDDPSDQINAIQDLISKGVDGLAVVPLAAEALTPTLKQVSDQGIPVSLVNTEVPGYTGYTSFIQSDNLGGGKLAGEFLKSALKDGQAVGFVQPIPGQESNDARIDGAREVLSAGGVKAYGPGAATNCSRDKALNQAEDLLAAHSDIGALYAACDQDALGALDAVKNSKRKDVIVLGFDGSDEGLESIRNHGLVGTVAQFPNDMGALGVETVVDALRKKPVKKDQVARTVLVTEKNVDSYNTAP